MVFRKPLVIALVFLACLMVAACTDTSATTTAPATTGATTATTTTTFTPTTLTQAPTTMGTLPTTTMPFTTTAGNPLYVSLPETAYPELAGLKTYSAAMGYHRQTVQGYNHWYYEVMTNAGSYTTMPHNGVYWSYEGANILDAVLMPAPGYAAVRKFVAPATGEATIYGTVRMYAEATADIGIRILVNDTQVYPETGTKVLPGSDLQGYYHKHTLMLAEGDVVRFLVETEADVHPLIYWNPVVDFLNLPDDPIHYGMTEYVGDVHPYYHDGKLYMYYLSRDGSFASTLATSTDMINFVPQTLTTTRLNAPGSFYYVLGVIKEGNYFRSFYGEGKNVGSSRSLDLLEWESGIVWDEETYEKQYSPASNYAAGTRDPFAYFNPDLNKYHIVATGYRANEHYVWSNTTGYDAYIVIYTSLGPSLADWEKNPVTGRVGYHRPLLHFGDWVNNVEIGDPECPQIFKIGDRWYILASLAGRGGDHWVGRPSYWVGDPGVDILAMDWQANIGQEYFLDGEDLCAAQIVEIEGKHYIFGWITQRNYSHGWGGTINIPREVYQKPDGTLGTRLDPDLARMLNSGNLYEAEKTAPTLAGFTAATEGYTLTSGSALHGYAEYGQLDAPGTHQRTYIDLELDLTEAFASGGIVVGGAANNVEIGIRKSGAVYELYLKNQGSLGKVSATNAVTLASLECLKLTIIIEGTIAEVFLNDEFALSARSSEDLSDDVSLSAFMAGNGGTIASFRINQLTPAKDFGR